MAHFANRQPGNKQTTIERGTIVPHDAEWRILAEEAAQENDPQKLIEIIEALKRNLGEQEKRKKEQRSEPRMRNSTLTERIESGRTGHRQT